MILLKYRDIEAKSPAYTKCRTQGIFRYRLWNEHGVKMQGEVKNLITNNGLDRLGVGSSQFALYCHIGTGTNAPAFGDPALGNFVASTSTAQPGNVTGQYVSGTPDYSFATRIFRFAAGVATGNMTEVGVSWQASGAVFNRALFLDESLNPIVIPKGAIDILDIEYENRFYAQWDDVAGSMVIGGVNRNFIVRACSVQDNVGTGLQWGIYSGMVGSNYLFAGQVAPAYAYATDLVSRVTNVNSTGSGGNSGVTGTRSTYVNGTHYTDITNTFGIDAGNSVGPPGIRRVGFGHNLQSNTKAFQCQFDPPLEKDNTKSLTLTLRISWDRV